jgi:hypothetical protein
MQPVVRDDPRSHSVPEVIDKNAVNACSVWVLSVGSAHPTGTTRLKMWAFRVLENAISIILSDRVTHIFSLVKPLLAKIVGIQNAGKYN